MKSMTFWVLLLMTSQLTTSLAQIDLPVMLHGLHEAVDGARGFRVGRGGGRPADMPDSPELTSHCRQEAGNVFLRYNNQDIINLSVAESTEVKEGEWFQYFGNFIIVRRSNFSFKKIINSLNRLALSFDGVTVQIETFTQPNIFGPGMMYSDEDDGVAFYTTSTVLINRIQEALGDPGGLPTPPPDEGDWSAWSSWSPCSITCGSGFRTRERDCEGCQANCCECPLGKSFQIDECLDEFCVGQWGGWSSWASCSRTCGGGFRTRQRDCEGPGECDFGQSFQSRQCNTNSCCN